MSEYRINKLNTDIEDLISTIDETINHMQFLADQRGIHIYDLKHVDGSSSLVPILMAKAKALQILVTLEIAQGVFESKEM